jgi:hypothetical protein
MIDVLETIDAVQGLAPETLNSLEKLASALNNDSNYFQTVSGAIGDKADKATTYTKTEVDTALNLKANQSSLDTTNATVALKADQVNVDTALNLKANQSNLDTTNAIVALKADQATTYTKTEVDTALNLKANQSSLETTNANVALKANQATTYTKTEVDTQFANLIDSAPEALNTLKELANALGDDANYAATVQNQLAGKQSTLTAGTGISVHEKLLEGNKVKSLVAGENITMTSTEEFVNISAAVPLPSSADGTGLSLVNAAGQVLRLLPGSGAYAFPVVASGSVELGVITQGAQFQAPFAVMNADKTSQRAQFSDTRADLFTDLYVNGTANVSGSLAASSFSCPEIFTNAVAPWSGGAIRPGDPQGGTVEMGKWRFRGSNPGEFYLERFDDDGDLRTDEWVKIATFGYTTNINSPGMGVDNFGVLYNFTAGNATVTGDLSVAGALTNGGHSVLTTDTAYTKAQINTALAGKANEFSIVTPVGGTNLLRSSILKGVRVNSPITLGADTDFVLDFGLDTAALANVFKPFWVAGRVDGSTMTILSSRGRYGFNIARVSGYPIGVINIAFDTPTPDHNYVVNLTMESTGFIRVWEATGQRPNEDGFRIVTNGINGTALMNVSFYFSVFV